MCVCVCVVLPVSAYVCEGFLSTVLGSLVLPVQCFTAAALCSCFASLANSPALILFGSSPALQTQHMRFLRHVLRGSCIILLSSLMIMGSAETNPSKTEREARTGWRVTAHARGYAARSGNALQVMASRPASHYFPKRNFPNEPVFIICHLFFF